mgnify:CR=1 FL=1
MIMKTYSHQETLKAGKDLGQKLEHGLLCFYGDLGAGKTTFIRGLAQGLGIKTRIQSPTFTYQRVHLGRYKLYHFDCYRVEKPDELILLDIQAALESGDGVVAIEWAEHVESFLPKNRISIHIEPQSDYSRKITFTQHD